MIERVLILVGGLSSKVFTLLMTSTSASLGIVFGAVTTHQVIWSAIAGALATVLASLVLVVPRVMEQRRKSRESAEKHQFDLLTQTRELHQKEVEFLQAQIAADRLIITLERNSKHNVVNEWGSMANGYRILYEQLKLHKIDPAIELEVKTYKELTEESDQEIKTINKARAEEASFATNGNLK